MNARGAGRAVLRGFGELCITLGLVLLLFLVWQLWWTDVAAGRTQHRLTEQLHSSWAMNPPPTPTGTSPGTSTGQPVVDDPPLRVADGQAFAIIHIPRFGKDYARPILQGVGLPVLDKGVGHYPDSVGPGAVGNFALAGHRVTYAKPFNQIAELRKGDAVVIETSRAWYVYRVVSHTVVTPDRVDVVAAVPGKPGAAPTKRMMTMTACHPKFSARERYVVFSELDQRIAKAPGVRPDALKADASKTAK